MPISANRARAASVSVCSCSGGQVIEIETLLVLVSVVEPRRTTADGKHDRAVGTEGVHAAVDGPPSSSSAPSDDVAEPSPE